MSKAVKGWLVLCLVLPALSVLLSGCWDRIEIENRALILAMAIDEASPEDMKDEMVTHSKVPPSLKDKMIRITAQIAVPGRVPLGPGGDSGGGEGSFSLPVWVVKVVGYTIDDALDNLQQQIADPRTLIHLRIVVISEAIARRGLRDLNDYFRRETQVRRTTWLLVSDVEAARLMDVAPPLERVPALYLLAMIEKSHQMGKFPTDYIGKFWSAESKLGQDGYLPYVSIRQKENILLKGMAYFNEDKMVGYTTPIQIGVYMGIMGLNPGGYSALFDVPGVGVVMVNTLKRSSRVKVKINDGIPHAEIDIQLEATMKEKIGEAGSFDSQAKLHEVERVFEQEVKKNAIQLIKETQLKKSDVFGFGEKIRAHERSFWNRNIKSEKDWENLYAKLTADVHVHVDLRRFGLVAQNKSE